MITTFIHVSDLHCDKDNFSSLFIRLSSLAFRFPDAVLIITGDLTNNGAGDEFFYLMWVLQHWQGRVVFVPGNHDYGILGNFYNQDAENRFNMFLGITIPDELKTPHQWPMVAEYQGIRIIGLDSNLKTETPLDFAKGEIGKQQRRALKAIINPDNYIPTILPFHHHPWVRDDFIEEKTMELIDAEQLQEIFTNAVDVVLFGHKHKQEIWPEWNRAVPLVHSAGKFLDENQVLKIQMNEHGLIDFDYTDI